MRKGLKITAWIVALLAVLLLAGLVAIQSPAVQTALGKKFLERFQEDTDATIHFESISIRPLEAILLKDLVVLDNNPYIPGLDTLLYVNDLSVKFSLRGLFKGSGAYVNRLRLHGGGFNLVMEPDPADSTHAVVSLLRALHLLSEPKESEDMHWGNILTAHQVDIQNFTFRMENIPGARRDLERGYEVGEGVIDWNHLRVLVESILVNNLKIANSLIVGQDARLQFLEKDTGIHFQEVSVQKLRVGEGLVHLEEVHADDGYSNILLEHFDMEGKLEDYEDYVNKVVIDGQIREGSLVDLGQTVGHFSTLNTTFRGYPRGHVRGTVNNLNIDNVHVQDADNNVTVNVSGSIKGVEQDVGSARLDFNVRKLSFDTDGLSGFVNAWAPDTHLDLKDIAPGELLNFEGAVTGILNDIDVDGQILSDIGSILADVYIRNVLDERKDMHLGGHLATSNLHLGKVLGTSSLGPLSMRTTLDAAFPDGGSMDVQLDTLQIARLQALEYDYTGISAHGTYKNESLQAQLVSKDPNLLLDFNGRLDLGETKDAQYRFKLDLQRADLAALNLDTREVSEVSLKAESDIVRADADNLDGHIRVSNIFLDSSDGLKRVGDVLIKTHQKDSLHRIDLESDFLTANYQGSRPILHFVKSLQDIFMAGELPALIGQPAHEWDGAQYLLSAQVLNAQDLLTFLVPGLYIENKTAAQLSIDREGLMKATVTSGRLAMNNRYVKDFRLEANNHGSSLSAAITGGTLDLGSTKLLNNQVNLKADDNHLQLGYTFGNKGDGKTYGNFQAEADLSRQDKDLAIKGRLKPSVFSFTGGEWKFVSNDINYCAGDISVDGLEASHQRQSLKIDGGLRSGQVDTLLVRMDQFDLALLNAITGGTPDLQGLATGRAVLISPLDPTPGLLASIVCDSVYVSGHPMGTLRIASNYNEADERFEATVRNDLNGLSNLRAEAFLKPSTKDLGVSALLDRLNLGYAAPFLESIFSEFGGALTGEVGLSGKLGNLHVNSKDLHVDDGLLTLDFTKVPYRMSGQLDLRDQGLFFKQVRLEDGQRGTGTVEGGLLFKDLKNLNLGMDIHVRFSQMHALNMPHDPEMPFFGSVVGSGQVDVTGDMNRINLDIEATTQSGEVHIPLGSMSGDTSREMLTFKQPAPEHEDPYEKMVASRNQTNKQESDLNVAVRVHATPGAQVFIDVDNESSLNCTGQGTIDLVSRARQGLFTLNGDYTLNSGSFHFSAMNLVSRDFVIQDGSSVRFNGDVMNTDLNVNGQYITKASLYNLTADESATTRRTVICGIAITGKLSNPELKFSIEIPDLNPTVQAQVEGALNTEDKIQKQFIYLLVAGNFLPSEESGISAGGSDVLFSNVSSIMSGQLNNIFQKLNIPLDLGLNYKNTQTGTNIFDVALSTQLFNNRVVVNGTVGNREDIAGGSNNTIAGDLDIEIKLNRSGSLRLSLFTHSADQLSAFLDNSQRNGGGIAYQMEFNTFKQLFRDLFSTRAQREKRAQEEALQPVKNVILQIDTTGKAHVLR